LTGLNVGSSEGLERIRRRRQRRENGADGLEKIAALKTGHYKAKEKAAGLEPHAYNGEEKKCGGRRNRATGIVNG
jgi:hypothetical protein